MSKTSHIYFDPKSKNDDLVKTRHLNDGIIVAVRRLLKAKILANKHNISGTEELIRRLRKKLEEDQDNREEHGLLAKREMIGLSITDNDHFQALVGFLNANTKLTRIITHKKIDNKMIQAILNLIDTFDINVHDINKYQSIITITRVGPLKKEVKPIFKYDPTIPEKNEEIKSINSQHLLPPLINDIIEKYYDNRLPNVFSKIVNDLFVPYKDKEEFLNNLDKDQFLVSLNEFLYKMIYRCNEMKNILTLQKRKKSYFLIRSIANYSNSIKLCPQINSIQGLMETQQKQDALLYFEEEKRKCKVESAAYYANQCMIDEIEKSGSNVDAKLGAVLHHALTKTVLTKNNEAFNLQALPHARVQEVLFDNRSRFFLETTAFKNFKKFTSGLVNIDDVLNPQLDETKKTEMNFLKNAINKHKNERIFKNIKYGRWCLLSSSGHFKGEKRIYVMEECQNQDGKETTTIAKMIGVWKIDDENNWRYVEKSNRYFAKIVSNTKDDPGAVAALIREVKYAQKKFPDAEFKKVITQLDEKAAIAREALIKGDSLADILEYNYFAQNPDVNLKKILRADSYELQQYKSAYQKVIKKSINNETVRLQAIQNKVIQAKINKNPIVALTQIQRIKLALAICKALQEHVHDRKTVHLDVKPGNIMIDLSNPNDPKVKFIDFEYSKDLNKNLDHAFGTPDYIDPELYNEKNLRVVYKKDIFSLTIILLEVLTGTPLTLLNRIEALAIEIATVEKAKRSGLIDRFVDQLISGSNDETLGNLKPLLDYLNGILKSDKNRKSLVDIISKLEHTLAPKKSKVHKIAESARKELHEIEIGDKKNKGNYRKIYNIIAKSLDKIKQEPIEEYLDILGIQVLKDWYALHKNNVPPPSRANVLSQVAKIIDEYELYEKKSQIVIGRDQTKMKGRYEKYQMEVAKIGITLDRMATVNRRNAETFSRYQFNFNHAVVKNDHDILINDKPSTLLQDFERLLALPEFSHFRDILKNNNDGLSGHGPSAKIELIAKVSDLKTREVTFKKNEEGLVRLYPNYLNDQFFSKSTYEKDLIYRAFSQFLYPTIDNDPNFNMEMMQFQSLTELLNYQQKQDVMMACADVIQKCEEELGNSHLAFHRKTYLKQKKEAYKRLYDALATPNNFNDHTLSVHEILANYRYQDEKYFKFFETKINNHGFFHVFQDSGDFFKKVCNLPEPKIYLNNISLQTKKKCSWP